MPPKGNEMNLLAALEQIEQNKGISRQEVVAMVESALVSAYRKHSGRAAPVEAKLDPQTGVLTACEIRQVVEKVTQPETELSLAEARKIRPGVQVGETVQVPIDTEKFARIAAQTAKQMLIQKIRETERDSLYNEYIQKKGQILHGTVSRVVDRNLILDLGKAEALLPAREQVPTEHYQPGDFLRALLLKVERSGRGPQLVVSRTHPDFIRRLFELEVPEVYDGTVEIVAIAREPGHRVKVAVRSKNPRVEAIGSCVGPKGGRVRAIQQELRGARIDMIPYDEDPAKYIASAIGPAKVVRVELNEEGRRAEVIVPDDQLSLAIGRNGINVRLASKLTGWTLDVKSESQKKKAAEESVHKEEHAPEDAEEKGAEDGEGRPAPQAEETAGSDSTSRSGP